MYEIKHAQQVWVSTSGDQPFPGFSKQCAASRNRVPFASRRQAVGEYGVIPLVPAVMSNTFHEVPRKWLKGGILLMY